MSSNSREATAALRLLPYQYRWIEDGSPVKVWEKSRRIGATWCTACEAVLDASRSGGSDWFYSGYNHEMALEFIEDCATWARRFNNAVSEIESVEVGVGTADPDASLFDEDKDVFAYRVRFSSGHRIVALSSRATNFRGKQGVAVIDEAAFHDDLPGMLKAALALTMWGGRILVLSTHNSAESEFAKLVSDIRAGRRPYALHRVTLDDALDQGLYRAICGELGREWSRGAEAVWREALVEEYGADADEELFCIPSLSGGVFLPSALIESCMSADVPVVRWHCKDDITRGSRALEQDAEDWISENLDPLLRQRLDPDCKSCFGEDFGRSGDLTVIWPLQISNRGSNGVGRPRHGTPFVVELRNVPFRQQVQVLCAMVDKLPRFVGGAMDARGNGQFLAEEAALKYGVHDEDAGKFGGIEQVMLTLEWYREAMPKLKAAFEDRSLVIPRDAGVLADLRLLRMEKGIARVPDHLRVKDPMGPGGRHGDSAIAVALAYYVASRGAPMYAYKSARGLDVPMGYGELAQDWKEDRLGGAGRDFIGASIRDSIRGAW